VSSLLQRYGTSVLVLCRGVPVLAEASVMAAGALGMPARRCIAATILANVGVAGLYATIGAAAWDVSPLAAFAMALLLPGILLIVASTVRRKGNANP
jgi:membrane protein DedA with SNARE-associated domain